MPATPRQLMHEAMSMGQPSRVPSMCQLAIGHVMLNTDIHPIDYFLSSEAYAEGLLRMREAYDFDGILLHKPGREPDFGGMIDSIDRDLDEPTIYLKDGTRVECMRNDDPYYRDDGRYPRPPIANLDPGDPFAWAPESFMHWSIHKGSTNWRRPEDFPDYWFDAINFVRRALNDNYSIHGEVRAPIDHFFMAAGIEEGAQAFITQREHTHRLMDAFADISTAWAVAQVQRGCDAIKISSPFAGAAFLSPEMYAEWVMPYEGRIAGAVREAGGFIYTHTCGAIGDRLDLMARAGLNGIETLDPPPLGTVDLDDAKDLLRDRLFIKGNIDPVNGLLRNNAENARTVVEDVYAVGCRGGQYILSTACSVAPPTPPENIKLLAECVRRHAGTKIAWTPARLPRPATEVPSPAPRDSAPEDTTGTDDFATDGSTDYAVMNQILYEGNAACVKEMTERALAEGISARTILAEGLIAGMSVVGEDFKQRRLFLPQVLVAAKAMKAGMAIVKPLLSTHGDEAQHTGTLLMGTVKGDLHDIGKNIVCMMAEGAGFKVVNIGVDQKADAFIQAAREHGADIVGMSALLTTTMVYMKTVIDAFHEAEMDDVSFVCVGGAPVTAMFGDEVGADGYADDAPGAVELFRTMMEKKCRSS